MSLSVYERAQRYVAKMDAAISGSRGHDATFAVVSALVNGFDLSSDDALSILRDYNCRCQPPWNENQLLHKIRSAEGSPSMLGKGYLLKGDEEYTPGVHQAASSPVDPPSYDAEKLKAFAGEWAATVDAAWLANRSPVEPSSCSTHEFLSALYHPDRGEKVLIFLNEYSQGEAVWPDCEDLPSQGRHGVWFLAQPVSGEYLPNPRSTPPGKASRRIAECVRSWRYLVLESDEAPARHWLGAVVQLPLKIAAIYTSGARSVHVLVEVDCATKDQWEREKAALLNGMVTLGACRGSLSGVRLTRLPNCLRFGKNVTETDASGKKMNRYLPFNSPGLQKLLYLCPSPSPRPLLSLIPRRDVIAELEASMKSLSRAIAGKSLAELWALHRRMLHFAGQSEKCKRAAADLDEILLEREAERIAVRRKG